MNNQFKKKIEEREAELREAEEQEEQKPESPEGSMMVFLRKFFNEGVVSKEVATEMLPFLIFICVLVMIYIGNSHMAVTNIRKIDKLSKEVTELSWEFKSLKADLMFKSKLTEVAKKVDTLGIKELVEPPKKIVVNR
ncbi:FtsL-like putative cell division protein [Pedobacter insulae]|uniref:Cell division protein FtsL n=1 Tax=Pedobacter insulae TaxID=414048 RepID=A0A1I2VU21_9SPHI|nr:FtsL-like putative cell division protein [Pedobacter insulae]SFG92734.1 hypothetical protein SAMN04489864_103269 [Pedobacter insulae]